MTEDGAAHPEPEAPAPSDWLLRWRHLLPAGARVLDAACGRGRHARALAAWGHRVTAVDRDAAALDTLRGVTGIETLQADLEGAPWPVPGRRFDLVLVTHYLWRPLWPDLLGAVEAGGLWIHETFNLAHAALGRPRRPEFLLRAGELLEVASGFGLHVIAYEEGRLAAGAAPTGREVQRIVARRPGPAATAPDLLPR